MISDGNNHSWISAKMVVAQLSSLRLEVSKEVVVGIVHHHGLWSHLPKKIFLTPDWCLPEMLKSLGLNSNETKHKLFGHMEAAFVWQRTSEAFRCKNSPHSESGGCAIMFWCCFKASVTGDFVWVHGKITLKLWQILLPGHQSNFQKQH